ncbi:MAG: hypothetical protein OJF62_000197 [Pseudolabrys sp.]|jgi:diguanylate cyclase (GGDEF)-like protein|nr:hypothetical protein [Pseudolabrys sp.]
MEDRRRDPRSRSLLGGRIVFNDRRSVVECVVRNFSSSGANLQVDSTAGIPNRFDLVLDGEDCERPCQAIWLSDNRVGVEFTAQHRAALRAIASPPLSPAVDPAHDSPAPAIRGTPLSLRAALDETEIGIVLLDADTRAQFINRAFRRMWRLPDEIAERKPPFVALMYHARDTRAYAVAPERVDAFVAERVARVKAGDPRPLDLRLSNGEVIRLTCAALPDGGRMLCYTYVTDIVRFNDRLGHLRAALDHVPHGVVLLDRLLNVEFMNKAARTLWAVDDARYERGMTFIELAGNAKRGGMYDLPSERIGPFVAERIAAVRAGDPAPVDIPHRGGRVLRAQCAVLPEGGRMITYTDVTDLARRVDTLSTPPAADGMTGLASRHQFDEMASVEWSRFQRYQRPMSLLVFDIDQLKAINDGYGHEAGDRAILHIVALCNEDRRASDLVARIGDDEFAILLPETELAQARIVAERLRDRIARSPFVAADNIMARLTVSIGLAQAALSMSGIDALRRAAEAGLAQAKAAGRDRVGVDMPREEGHKAAAE